MGIRFSAINQGNDMGMVETFEDLDFAVEVIFELAVQLRKVDRLDSYKSSGGLQEALAICALMDWKRQ